MLYDTPRISSRLDLLYLVTREFNAGLDINKVLHNVLTATVASVGASEASLLLADTEGKLEKSLIISGFEAQSYSPQLLQTVFEQGIVNWVWENKTGAVVTDTQTDERWYQENISPEIKKARSAVSVPIQKSPEAPIGVLTITTDQPNYFDDSDLAMLTIIGDQAAFALTNAQLFEAEQDRRRLADTLISIAHTINASLDLDEVLNLILEQLSLVVEYDSSSILLYDDETQTLSVQAAHGFDDMADALNVTLPFDENSPNFRAIIGKKPVLINDVDQEPYWVKSSSSRQVKSWIGAPLLARDEVVGMLTVDSHEINKYSAENVNIVAAFADQGATAVANAQAVTRLQKAEASYSALFEDSTDMIIITDYEGDIWNVNRKGCQIFRRPKDAFIGLNISFLIPGLKKFLIKHTKLLQAWRETSIEVEITDAYRQKIPLEIRVRHIQYGDRQGVEWVGRDISARKEIEKMRQDLVNMLVHDLRGPLGNLINTIDLVTMIVSSTSGDENLKRFLQMGKRTGRILTDLVDSMLDVSRLEEGEVPLQRSMTSMVELIQQVGEQVEHQAAAKQTTLIINPVPEDISEAWLDNSLIRRVLTNLVGNAVKYSQEEAEVSLTTMADNNRLHFAVKDNGPGIQKVDQERIFNKFSRLSQTDHTSGVGLGLAFCKLAIEAHNGQIYVESEGIPGKGSTFHVVLPLLAEPFEEEDDDD